MAKILVVDDDDLSREAMRRIIARDGHAVTEATNGIEAVDALSKESFDLLVTDIFMPRKDGLEVVLSLRRMSHRPRVIAVTGSGSGAGWSPLTTASALGADTVLAKPFLETDLLRLIRRLLPPPGPSDAPVPEEPRER